MATGAMGGSYIKLCLGEAASRSHRAPPPAPSTQDLSSTPVRGDARMTTTPANDELSPPPFRRRRSRQSRRLAEELVRYRPLAIRVLPFSSQTTKIAMIWPRWLSTSLRR
jgi:hypothetical protein